MKSMIALTMVATSLTLVPSLAHDQDADHNLTQDRTCNYHRGNGIYWSTYGGVIQRDSVQPSDLGLLDDILAYPYVDGIAHYQNWSTLEVGDGVFNWTVLDAVFAAATRHNKSVLLGYQMGVCAPKWLLERPDVKTFSFVHANPGWFSWATLQSYSHGFPVITMASPWNNPVYDSRVQSAVRALSERFGTHPNLAWVNVAGASASGGVEANFNVNANSSRIAVDSFDESMNFTRQNYINTWKRRIDLYWHTFSGRVGMATHNQPGFVGFENKSITVYTPEQQMAVAREIRDYMVSKGELDKSKPVPVIRCCGGNNRSSEWGVPNVTVGPNVPPPSTYAQLMWEVREKAEIGFEQASIVGRGVGRDGLTLQNALKIQEYYNGRYLEFKTPEFVNMGGNVDPSKASPYAPSVPYFTSASTSMKGCCLPWQCP